MPSTMRPDDTFQPSNSVDLLQSRARRIADQSLQSTQRMVVMVDESKEVAICAMANLDEQKVKLNLVDEAHNEINEEIKQSEKALTEMEKCCGVFPVPWKWPLSRSKTGNAWKKEKEYKIVSNQPKRVQKEEFDEYLPRITNDVGEEEMDGNLAHVHSTVGNLRSMAAGINAEVRAQNAQLDKLKQKADSNDQHVQAAAQRTDKLHH